MRALIYHGPNQLQVERRPEPDLERGEALVKIRYVGICGTDLHHWAGEVGGVVPPVVVGHELVGEVEASDAAGFAAGDRVVIRPLLSCGRCRACREGAAHVCRELKVQGVHADGGAAELMPVPGARLHRVPPGLTWEAAACTEPTAVAVHMVRRSGLELGDTVLVLGGGPIGFLVASVARAAGAGRVLIAEVSPHRIAFNRTAGFEVVDASAANPADVTRELTDGEGADVVFEVAGAASAAKIMVAAVRVRGTVLIGGVFAEPPAVDLRGISAKEVRLVGSRVYEPRDFETALVLLDSGAVDVRSLVTRIVPLDEAVLDGYARLRDSRAEMKVLIQVPG